MYSYIATIFDIKNIQSPKYVDEVVIAASSRSEAIDRGHTEAERLYPKIKRMINIRQMSYSCS